MVGPRDTVVMDANALPDVPGGVCEHVPVLLGGCPIVTVVTRDYHNLLAGTILRFYRRFFFFCREGGW